MQAEDFDVGAEIAALRQGATGSGAFVTFTGIVREYSSGRADGATSDKQLTAMTLEHYPGMTARTLEAIEVEARSRWPLDACLIVHRYGRLEPGANIVLVITASPHRLAAFEAAEFLVDWLKTKAPFWKLEESGAGGHWVEAKAIDDKAADRWTVAAPGPAQHRKAG